MNILLLGSGGREHALAWKLAQSPTCSKLFAAPGNPGIAEEAELVDLNASNHAAVVDFCDAHDIGLVVIGPEAPLVDGLADSLRDTDIPVFGPSMAAAQLEGSKGFTKDLCQRAGIPTAGYVRTSSLDEATDALDRFEPPYVLKADGLAAGKGVVIAETRTEAETALADMFGGQFGEAGAEVVIEEFMTGEEASFFALTDGTSIIPFGTAQDHKRVGDGDVGPNTGGMGAYSPAPVLTEELQTQVMAEIIEPTVLTMRQEGIPYSGVLYAGLMLTEGSPKLIEYNCRFGDPECQVLMTRLDSDLAAIMLACANGSLAGITGEFSPDTAMTVVMAARGYPGTPEKAGAIDLGDAEATGAKVFHAGTSMRDGQLVANGGRVLNVTATGANATEAQKAAYTAVDAIDFPSGFCRRDIGWREVAREANN
ncbi:phosphoribosylamine--glycine ligase [Altererythrobacter sp.]|uniref:phosphoribosylamine--glycine ligase n=1 Tax=Altererythrobacter sp. TaxID=1872480 RepID=UPI001AFD883A|nr:phosphoribosylamine--glycine ligase [Altererythrobacter sp.]MBO6609454.1 phosphoribosylamine--glycine ligase [Altererythrobacter sp.]MBO6642321.1 phosphoribosylamine--glycine ligase [Altererythrobacter sp.]MBO6709171.1 phosphoribosylamine--glycine ligase [Altererythrobacter sp.]MBO6944721.1 phosphoribosylamine--glycine ligase [Altererythrobacter sp.]